MDKQKEKRRVLAIAKRLKEQKGIMVSKLAVDDDLRKLKKAKKEAEEIGANSDSAVVKKASEETQANLQSVIDNLNDYMGIIYPEGLIDLGGEELGSTMSISG